MAATIGNAQDTNVGDAERKASVLGGGALVLYGLTRRSWGGLALAALGGALVQRGVSGHCHGYAAACVNTAEAADGPGEVHSPVASVRHNHGIKVEQRVTVNKSPEVLYGFWRDFENLPRFLNHVESVQVLDEKKSHWVVKAPAGQTVEWDATIHNEVPNEIIAWRSLDGDINNAGSVRFTPVPGDRGTEVKVTLEYEPPVGTLGVNIAKLFGEEPEQQVADDLRRFKQLMEAGEVPTTEGQPRG